MENILNDSTTWGVEANKIKNNFDFVQYETDALGVETKTFLSAMTLNAGRYDASGVFTSDSNFANSDLIDCSKLSSIRFKTRIGTGYPIIIFYAGLKYLSQELYTGVPTDGYYEIEVPATATNYRIQSYSVAYATGDFADFYVSEYLNVKKTASSVGVSTELTKYGSFATANGSGETVSGVRLRTNTTPCTKRGLLQQIVIPTNKTGLARFAVGSIDQRNQARLRVEFDVTIESGVIYYDVSDENIIMEVGDYLFVLADYYGNGFTITFSAVGTSPFYGLQNTSLPAGITERTDLYYRLGWVLKEIISENTPTKIEQLNNLAEIASSNARVNAIESFKNTLIDKGTGIPYKLKVVSGSLSISSMVYENAFLIGSSSTIYGNDLAVGWEPDDLRSMAATTFDTDLLSWIDAVLKQKSGTASCLRYSQGISYYENYPSVSNKATLDAAMEAYQVANPTIDAIFTRFGGNATAANMLTVYEGVISKLVELWPAADIYVTGEWLNRVEKIALQSQFCAKNGLTFISCSDISLNSANYAHLSDFCINNDGVTYYPIVYEGVANSHMNDLGMLLMANKIANAIIYDELDKQHSIILSSTYTGDIEVNDSGVEGQIISIKCVGDEPSSVVVNGGAVTVAARTETITYINSSDTVPDFIYSFIMPSGTATIVIS